MAPVSWMTNVNTLDKNRVGMAPQENAKCPTGEFMLPR